MVAGAVIAVLLGWNDPAARRALYEQFPVYPGADEVSAEPYRVDGDTWPTRNRGLRVTYGLPADVTAAEVIGFYRANMPPGWTEATDETCEVLIDPDQPPPSTDVDDDDLDSDEFVLLHRESRLTVFVPGEDGAPDGSVEGIGFTLRRVGAQRFVALDSADYECGPPQDDSAAAAFDRGM